METRSDEVTDRENGAPVPHSSNECRTKRSIDLCSEAVFLFGFLKSLNLLSWSRETRITTTDTAAMPSTSVKIECTMGNPNALMIDTCALCMKFNPFGWCRWQVAQTKRCRRRTQFLVAQVTMNRAHANSNIATNLAASPFLAAAIIKITPTCSATDFFVFVFVFVRRRKFLPQLNESLGHTNNL